MTKHEYLEINKIEEEAPFDFVLSVRPIDDFEYALTKKQIIENIVAKIDYNWVGRIQWIMDVEKFVIKYTEKIDEAPLFVRYIGMPRQDTTGMDLIAIARVSNNGTGYVYSDNKEHLEYIKAMGE